MKWLADGGVSVEVPKKPKKITGTRFGAVLGRSPWSTPFKTWCEITKTYEEPYEDTIYTITGKKIEPKQIEYLKMWYDGVTTPTDVYGTNPFKITHGDFYADNPIFGGMWDSLIKDDNGNIDTVVEFKTTKRSEDWETDIPEYYALQAALYAYLLGVDKVMMVCTILDDKDYLNPDVFEVDYKNTFNRQFKVSERYPDMADLVAQATEWWSKYVLTGNSPVPTDTDADIVKILHTTEIDLESDEETLLKEFETLKGEIDAVKKSIEDKEKRLKALSDTIKGRVIDKLEKGEIGTLTGFKYILTVSPSKSVSVDKTAMELDGILEKYSKESTTYKLNVKEIK